MITNILFALGGSIAGFLVCAFFTAGKLADAFEAGRELGAEHAREAFDVIDHALATGDSSAVMRELVKARIAHKRCADSQSIALEKLRAIREIANKPQTIRKGDIRAVLGDVA